MRLFPRISIALLAALALAAILLLLAGTRFVNWPTELVFIFFSLLLWGWMIYAPVVGLHYWLLQRFRLQSTGTSAFLGAGVAATLWVLAAGTKQLPSLLGHASLNLLLFAGAGALYGFVYYCLARRK